MRRTATKLKKPQASSDMRVASFHVRATPLLEMFQPYAVDFNETLGRGSQDQKLSKYVKLLQILTTLPSMTTFKTSLKLETSGEVDLPL